MDTAEYARRVRESRDEGRCFICRIVSGRRSHQIVYEDAESSQAALAQAIRSQL